MLSGRYAVSGSASGAAPAQRPPARRPRERRRRGVRSSSTFVLASSCRGFGVAGRSISAWEVLFVRARTFPHGGVKAPVLAGRSFILPNILPGGVHREAILRELPRRNRRPTQARRSPSRTPSSLGSHRPEPVVGAPRPGAGRRGAGDLPAGPGRQVVPQRRQGT